MQANLNGANIYFEVHGKGIPIVLIAGLTAHGDSWPNQLPEFVKQFQIIALDNRNAGRSHVDDTNYSTKTMADDVIALLDHLQIPSAHIVGRSMGGYIAQEVAINYPSYVNKLVLLSTAPISSRRNMLLFNHLLQLKDPAFEQRLLWKELVFWENSPLLLKNEETLEAVITDCLADPYLQTYAGFKNQIQAIKEHDILDRVQLIKAPTLVISGELDLLIQPKEGKVLSDNISNAHWECLPEAGHGVHNDQAMLFNRLVLEFFAS